VNADEEGYQNDKISTKRQPMSTLAVMPNEKRKQKVTKSISPQIGSIYTTFIPNDAVPVHGPP
jgi:hypothetical protein